MLAHFFDFVTPKLNFFYWENQAFFMIESFLNPLPPLTAGLFAQTWGAESRGQGAGRRGFEK